MDGITPIFVEATPENLEALLAAAVVSSNPRQHLRCDWLRNPTALGLTVYPPKVYEKIRELKNANTNS